MNYFNLVIKDFNKKMYRPTEPKKKSTYCEFKLTYYVIDNFILFGFSFIVIAACFVVPIIISGDLINVLFALIPNIWAIGLFFLSLSKRDYYLKINKPSIIVKIEKEEYEREYTRYLNLLNEYEVKVAIERKERVEILKFQREEQRLRQIEQQKQQAENIHIENEKRLEEIKKQEELRLIKEKKDEADRLKRIKEEEIKKEKHKKEVIISWRKRIDNCNLKIREDWPNVVLFMDERGIDKLYHFTDISNLESIVQHGGLFSWVKAQNLGILIPKPGGIGIGRVLDVRKGLSNYVRLSYNKKNKMRYVAVKEERINKPVFLEIDPIVMLIDDTLFTNGNATRNDIFSFNEFDKLVDLFNKKVRSNLVEEKRIIKFNSDDVDSSAEIMVHQHIPLDYILNIHKLL